MNETAYFHGHFVWRELMTKDAGAARKFYTELFGWTYSEMDMGGGAAYTLFKCGETTVAGMMQTPPDAPFPPFWTSYASVPDVDASVEAAKSRGGNVMLPAQTMPGVGRFAVLADPNGAVLGLLKAETKDEPPSERPGAGTFCWETLMTPDVDASVAFYGAVVGWTLVPGPNPEMKVFGIGNAPIADIQVSQPGMHPAWGTYVVVEALEAARDKALGLGATVIVPLIDVPSVGRITVLQDPGQAVISLFEAHFPPAQ